MCFFVICDFIWTRIDKNEVNMFEKLHDAIKILVILPVLLTSTLQIAIRRCFEAEIYQF